MTAAGATATKDPGGTLATDAGSPTRVKALSGRSDTQPVIPSLAPLPGGFLPLPRACKPLPAERTSDGAVQSSGRDQVSLRVGLLAGRFVLPTWLNHTR
jgi:hypothetical protein